MMLRRSFCLAVLLVIAAGTSAYQMKQAGAERAQTAPARQAYVFGASGQFVRVALESARPSALWMLPRVDGLAKVVRPYVPPGGRTAAGIWLPFAAAAAGDRLVLVLPKASGTVDEASDERQIVVLGAPMLDLRGAIPIGASSVVVVGPRRIFVSQQLDSSESRDSARLDVYDLDSLSLVTQFTDTVGPQASARGERPAAALAEGASVTAAGDFVVDGFRRIALQGSTLAVEEINPAALLSDAQRKQLQTYQRQDPVSKRLWLPYTVAGSAGGRVVFRLVRRTPPRMALIAVDAIALRVLSVFEVPTGHVKLTEDGKLVVLDEGERRPEESSNPPGGEFLQKTGRISRYDLESGREVGAVVDAALSGRAEHFATICLGAADDPSVYAGGDRLFVINWRAVPSVREVQADLPAAALARCALASR